MTNFQGTGAGTGRVSREQLLRWLPAGLGVLLSLGIGAGLVWPQWQQLQLEEQELQQLEEQRQRLPLLRAQLAKLNTNLETAEQRRRQILGLVAGSGEISTFMAQLSEEAQRSGVQLDGYEPVIITAPPEPSTQRRSTGSQEKNKPPPPPPDPLLAPGLQKTSLLLTARGSGPQLLAFLRGLETLSLLVVQSDLSLKHEASKEKAGSSPPTSLRLQLSLYSREQMPH